VDSIEVGGRKTRARKSRSQTMVHSERSGAYAYELKHILYTPGNQFNHERLLS